MKVDDFLTLNPVFRFDEFYELLSSSNSTSQRTQEAHLRNYLRRGRIRRIKRGLYMTVPPGQTPDSVKPDLFLVAAKMTPDAVLAYHTALEFHGRSYSIFTEFYSLTNHSMRKFKFDGMSFRGVPFSRELVEKKVELFDVKHVNRSGVDVSVTSMERTLVDVLDRPVFGGGWEEIWRSLESIEYFNLDKVVEYAFLLANSTTIAKVGFYLESNAERLMVNEKYLDALGKGISRKPHYMDRNNRKGGQLMERWNLIVPKAIVDQSWEELRMYGNSRELIRKMKGRSNAWFTNLNS